MRMRERIPRASVLALVGIVIAVFASACGSSEDGGTTASNASTAAGGDGGDDFLAEAKAAVAKGMEAPTGGVPTSGPAGLKNKFVVTIPCSTAAEGCAQAMNGSTEAAKTLGWRTTQLDGKGTAAGANDAIVRAIALKPDAIVMNAIDPGSVKGAIKQARDAGIVVVISNSAPSPLADFSDNPPTKTQEAAGALAADFMITNNDGEAKSLVFTGNEFAVVNARIKGVVDELAKCTTCETLAKPNFNLADLATTVPQLAQQTAQSNADWNAAYIPYDTAFSAFKQGWAGSGGTTGKTIVGTDGSSQPMTCIAEDCGLTGTVAIPLRWIGWANIDAVNRIMQDEDPAPSSAGIPIRLFTKENVPPGGGLWSGDFDYEAAFKKLWKVD